jgi:hypothetical protein
MYAFHFRRVKKKKKKTRIFNLYSLIYLLSSNVSYRFSVPKHRSVRTLMSPEEVNRTENCLSVFHKTRRRIRVSVHVCQPEILRVSAPERYPEFDVLQRIAGLLKKKKIAKHKLKNSRKPSGEIY